ncbi:MAG: NAD(P)-binding domain-containing protein [Pseudomonadota bacterium]
MMQIDTAIVGAGQAGLAMSVALSTRGVEHVLLERGTVANSWKTERWDSLTTLTPNWANGLPGAPYAGADPDGFMHVSELVRNMDAYAGLIQAPVQHHTQVLSATPQDGGFLIRTSQRPLTCRALVIASGASSRPTIPGVASALPDGIAQTVPPLYKRPTDLPPGEVLVVGASASGVQIARELLLAGHPVTIAVGSHLRMPRRYRGQDIEWWLDALGFMDERAEEIDDLTRARRLPSPQLYGGPDPVDLNALQDMGARVVGRLMDVRGGKALFSGGLSGTVTGADLKMHRLLDDIDRWITDHGLDSTLSPPDRPAPTRLPPNPELSRGFGLGAIRSVVWATGFRPDLDWLSLPAFDPRGRLRHQGGVVSVPGVYAMGMPILRRRRSHQISGVGQDAEALAAHLHGHLSGRAIAAA